MEDLGMSGDEIHDVFSLVITTKHIFTTKLNLKPSKLDLNPRHYTVPLLRFCE
jgi:hypothetical protein